ncbi:hypothetical protein [Loigolactobacillus jiayinensis]|uniref:Uncharacterized protein n=1 Tax=Loigolactobacillus jiayinensis TaxID=2486016 RepID=A0ABW1RES5_9LACO|nr:hypothetical protein [Loigolactobacillus jiayinensis]
MSKKHDKKQKKHTNENSAEPAAVQMVNGKDIYGEIVRDFPQMLDYLSHLQLSPTNTCIALHPLANCLQVRLSYSSDLQTDFAIHPQKRVVGAEWRAVAASLIIRDRHVTGQEQAWLIGQGLATYILHIADYVPDFAENTAAMNKWTVEKLATALLLPEDLVQETTALAMDITKKQLTMIAPHNKDMVVNYAQLNVITHTAAQLANVPEWLMKQRIDAVFSGRTV